MSVKDRDSRSGRNVWPGRSIKVAPVRPEVPARLLA